MFDNSAKMAGDQSNVVPGNTPQIPNEGDMKRVRYLDQIFDPDIHPIEDINKYWIGQEGEIVLDTENHRKLIIKHVDKYATWKHTYEVYVEVSPDPNTTDYQLFPEHEYGFLQGELSLMIDYSVRPPIARVDSNATAPNAAYALLYLGNIIGEKGQIISASYVNQDLINNRITVSPVVYDNLENYVIQGCNSFSVQLNEAALPNGTRCTLVYYDQGGRPIPKTYPVVVQHCAYLKDHQLDRKYVKSVELVSPWFTSSTKPNTLFVPINVTLKSVEFRARVHYSDGSASEDLPVNSFNGDNGFTLHGLNAYKPTTPGQVSEAIALTYTFKEHEQAAMAQVGSPDHITVSYEIVATPSKGAYTPRLYTYPYWDPATGWKYKHFLTDLNRKFCRDVTDKATLNNASPVFQGQLYGVEQPLIFNLNMRDVGAEYEPWAFVQHTTITLFNPGTTVGRKWDVKHSYSKPGFANLELEFWNQVSGVPLARFGSITDTAEFITKGYDAFEPSMDPRAEVNPPVPTHFDLLTVTGTSRTGIAVSQWNNLPLAGLALTNGQGIFIRWIKRDASGNDLQLGVSAAVCKLINNPN